MNPSRERGSPLSNASVQQRPSEAQSEYGIDLADTHQTGAYAGIILAVAHDAYREMGSAQIRTLGADKHLFFDLKNVFDADESDLRL